MAGRLTRAIAGLLCGLLGAAACVDETRGPQPDALAGFRVEIVDDSALGAPPYEFPAVFTPVPVRVEALLSNGEVKRDYDGIVQVRIVPGEVDPRTRLVSLSGGENPSHELMVRYAFGETRIWVEEVGLDQRDQCRDGFDNDGNGRLDFPGDPGCYGVEDPSEGGATYVTGLSEPIPFNRVSIRNVQHNPEDETGESPVQGDEVLIIDRGNLLVTNVTSIGFFVTDLAEQEGFGHIFLFNFNFPDGVLIGDRLSYISGGVDEFQGDTQLTFPDWEVDPGYFVSDAERQRMARCEPPSDPETLHAEPVLLTPADLNDFGLLESHESGLVRVEDVALSTVFMDCDFDESSNISGAEEEACRGVCQESNLCTELSNFEERDQFTADAGGSTVYVSSAEQVAEFNAFERCQPVGNDPPTWECPERRFASITGNLRHVFLTQRVQLWEVIPRYACDLRFACQDDLDCLAGQVCIDGSCS